MFEALNAYSIIWSAMLKKRAFPKKERFFFRIIRRMYRIMVALSNEPCLFYLEKKNNENILNAVKRFVVWLESCIFHYIEFILYFYAKSCRIYKPSHYGKITLTIKVFFQGRRNAFSIVTVFEQNLQELSF